MRIALCQLDTRIADLAAAEAAIRSAAATAAAGGATLALFPELAAFGGYPPRDLLDRRWLVERQWAMVQDLARSLPLPVILGAVEPLGPGPGPALANALVVLADGKVQAVYHKRLLPNYDVFDEARHFRAGTAPLIVSVAGLRIGLTICEDIWAPEFGGGRYVSDPVAELVGRCDLVVNASASPWHQGKEDVRRRLLTVVARRLGCPLAWVNQAGAHDELLFDGDSCLVDRHGAVIASAARWQAEAVIADTGAPAPARPRPEPMADLHAALVAGIRGYCGRTGQKQVVLGLSGGIDSALVATLAADAIGSDNVLGVLMPGPYSSPGSVSDALALARNLGIRHETVAITAAYAATLDALAPFTAGTTGGLMHENLQARLRGVVVMAAANRHGAMALTTGNKSEIATGYCTIYGDMNGGLAPIGDVYKTQVWELSRAINHVAGRERIPEASITKVPSAELRPDQTDQDSLPPYPVLDRILRQLIEDATDPESLIRAGEDAATVRQVARLLELSEFKRRQGAPILRVTAKAFGVGRRMPIARAIGPLAVG